MKGKNAITLIAVFLSALVLLSGCSVFNIEVEEAAGNIINGGFITEDSGWLYFNRMEGDTIYLYRERTNGSRGARISTDAGAPISLANEWLYYSKFGIDDADTEAGVLFKVKPDGADRTMISEEKAYNVVVEGEYAYYLGIYGTIAKLIRIHLETKEKTVLTEDSLFGFILEDEWIYYVNLSDTLGNLYRMKLDGSGKEKLNDDKTGQFTIDDGFIYFVLDETPYSDGAGGLLSDEGLIPVFMMYKMKYDGSERSRVAEVSNGSMNVHKGWIYYQDNIDGMVYRVKTDGTGKIRIRDNSLTNIIIIGDWIYFYDNQQPDSPSVYRSILGSMYRMKLDGSERSRVAEVSNGSMNVHKGWIYYQDNIDGMVYRVKTDGTGKIRIRDNSLTNIIIIGDWIYFYDNQQPDSPSVYRAILGSMYRMKLDGSDEELFE